jgi:Spy/CpxP family protein refolding chaperone
MKHTKIIAAMALFALVATGMPASAQERDMYGPSGMDDSYVLAFKDGPPSEERREEAMKKVQTLKKWRLIEELNLDEATADKFLPLVSSIDRERRELMKERRENMRGLKEILGSQTPDERKIKQRLDGAEGTFRKMQELRDREIKAAREHLTYEQQARFLIFNKEFEREMRRMIKRSRGGRKGGFDRPGGERFGGPEEGMPPQDFRRRR